MRLSANSDWSNRSAPQLKEVLGHPLFLSSKVTWWPARCHGGELRYAGESPLLRYQWQSKDFDASRRDQDRVAPPDKRAVVVIIVGQVGIGKRWRWNTVSAASSGEGDILVAKDFIVAVAMSC